MLKAKKKTTEIMCRINGCKRRNNKKKNMREELNTLYCVVLRVI